MCIGPIYSNSFTSLESLLKKFDYESRSLAFKANSLPEFNSWKDELTAVLKDITGINKLKPAEFYAETLETTQMDGYSREYVIIQTEEGVRMPFYILIPDIVNRNAKNPCIIAAHGHGSGGKYAIAGREDIPEIAKMINYYNYDLGRQLALEGFIVFCPDARGAGERREKWAQGNAPESILDSSCNHLCNIAVSLGYTLTALMAFDLMRLIDYIETLAYCDAGRIGCCGFSGGGQQTLWLSIFDQRVKCSAISVYFYGFKDASLNIAGCDCNYVPHLWEFADMGDLGALIAPRPLLIESGNSDPLNGDTGIANVIEQVNITKAAYKLFGKDYMPLHYIHNGGHQWYGMVTADFFKKYL